MSNSADMSQFPEETKSSSQRVQKDHISYTSIFQLLKGQEHGKSHQNLEESFEFMISQLTLHLIDYPALENILQTNILKELYAISLFLRMAIRNKLILHEMDHIQSFLHLYIKIKQKYQEIQGLIFFEYDKQLTEIVSDIAKMINCELKFIFPDDEYCCLELSLVTLIVDTIKMNQIKGDIHRIQGTLIEFFSKQQECLIHHLKVEQALNMAITNKICLGALEVVKNILCTSTACKNYVQRVLEGKTIKIQFFLKVLAINLYVQSENPVKITFQIEKSLMEIASVTNPNDTPTSLEEETFEAEIFVVPERSLLTRAGIIKFYQDLLLVSFQELYFYNLGL